MNRAWFEQAAAFLRLALPMVISRAGIAGMSIADGVMVSRNSPAELARLGLADGTIGRLLDVGAALLLGGIVLAARAQASAMPREAGAVWRRAMALALITGSVATLIGCASGSWLGWLGESPALTQAAGPVVVMLGAGVPAALVAVATAVFLEAVGHAAIVAIAVVVANLFNIGFNQLLISGGHGLPAMGALGSAMSTFGVQVMLAVCLVTYAWTLPEHERLGIRRPGPGVWSPRGAEQRRLGYGTAAVAAVLNGLGMALPVLAGWLGTLALATYFGLFNLLALGALLALGVADATALRVAAARGRRSPAEALAAYTLGLTVMLALLAVPATFALLGSDLLARFYAPDEALHEMLLALLPLGVLVVLCDGCGVVTAAALRGLGEIVWPTGIQCAAALALVPLAWWLAIDRGGGVPGLVEAILLVGLVRAGLLALRFRVCTVQPAPAAALQH